MAISLLHCNEIKSDSYSIEDKFLYRLSLDRTFSYICADVKKRDYFLSIISELTSNKEEILYRQDIIKDFQNNPLLLDRLVSVYSRFEELKSAQMNVGKDEYRLNITGNSSPSASKNILQTQAVCLKRALLFIKGFGEILSKCDLQSDGLKSFKAECRRIYENEEFSKLLTFCSKYENFSTNGFLDFKFVFNDEGRISEYELIDHRYIKVTDPDIKKKGFLFFKKEEDKIYPCERIYPEKDDFYERLTSSAISDMSKLFSSICDQIFTRFSPISRELNFYYVALQYINTLSEKSLPYCFPTISENKNIQIKKLYDLYLSMTNNYVVPNDFEMGEKSGGIVIFGDNGSGKTVYLRSIATMQILAQSGLPIPCESAAISLHTQIAAQFSESENFEEGNEAGRFEYEVRELALMADTLKKGALVFLNETFQSTSYIEGAHGLYDLLQYFSKLNIRWILVSHLRQLEDMLVNDEQKILHTTEGYKVTE